jgi:hypothetical protein
VATVIGFNVYVISQDVYYIYIKRYDTDFVLQKLWRVWRVSDKFSNVKSLTLNAVITESIAY